MIGNLKSIILFLVLMVLFTKAISKEKVEFVIHIFRHGARESLLENPKGPITDFGKAQQYVLGQEFRHRYVGEDKLLSEKYNYKQFRLHTSPKQRAIDSLKWFVSGFYPYQSDNPQDFANSEEYKFRGLKQEIPPLQINEELQLLAQKQVVHKKSSMIGTFRKPPLDENGKDMFYHAYDSCKKVMNYLDRLKVSNNQYLKTQDLAEQIWKKTAQIINRQKSVEQHKDYPFNENKPNLGKLGKLLDFYACNQFSGDEEKISEFTPEIIKELRQFKTKILQLKFEPLYVKKICATEHLMQIADMLYLKFQENAKSVPYDEDSAIELSLEQLKMLVYSCHDRNIYILLMNLVSERSIEELGYEFYVPPFSSSLVIEIVNVNPKKSQTMWNTNELFLEIKLNDQQLEWKSGGYRIGINDFLSKIIPDSIVVEYQEVCSGSKSEL